MCVFVCECTRVCVSVRMYLYTFVPVCWRHPIRFACVRKSTHASTPRVQNRLHGSEADKLCMSTLEQLISREPTDTKSLRPRCWRQIVHEHTDAGTTHREPTDNKSLPMLEQLIMQS